MLLSIIRAFVAYREYRRQIHGMAQLSDRDLEDIGMERPQMPRGYAESYRDRLLIA